jgi:two-component system, OmpR family, phosphate regulon response regulator PhoB
MEPVRSILIVEDEQAIADLVCLALTETGVKDYRIAAEHVTTAEQALFLLQQKAYDLVILDWMLPGEQGLDVIKRVKSQFQKIEASFLMLTAKSDPESIVEGLEAGADDFMTKPFDVAVLVARVRNILRRRDRLSSGLPLRRVELKGLILDFDKVEITLQEAPVHLTPSEFKLLGILLQSRGRVLTREQLIDKIQGEDVSVTGRTVDTHVFALRKKLGEWGHHIETIRGVGYRIVS